MGCGAPSQEAPIPQPQKDSQAETEKPDPESKASEEEPAPAEEMSQLEEEEEDPAAAEEATAPEEQPALSEAPEESESGWFTADELESTAETKRRELEEARIREQEAALQLQREAEAEAEAARQRAEEELRVKRAKAAAAEELRMSRQLDEAVLPVSSVPELLPERADSLRKIFRTMVGDGTTSTSSARISDIAAMAKCVGDTEFKAKGCEMLELLESQNGEQCDWEGFLGGLAEMCVVSNDEVESYIEAMEETTTSAVKRVTELENLYACLEKAGGSGMDSNVLRNVLSCQSPQSTASEIDREASSLMTLLDTSGDGFVKWESLLSHFCYITENTDDATFDRVISAWSNPAKQTVRKTTAMAELFTFWDVDGDGLVRVDELASYCAESNPKGTWEDAKSEATHMLSLMSKEDAATIGDSFNYFGGLFRVNGDTPRQAWIEETLSPMVAVARSAHDRMKPRLQLLELLYSKVQHNGQLGVEEMSRFVQAQAPSLSDEQVLWEAQQALVSMGGGDELQATKQEFLKFYMLTPGFWEPGKQFDEAISPLMLASQAL